MSNYRQTAATGRAGITRTKHLRYNIESYIIRTQALYDLVLKLIDAVFHLLNSDSQCRHAIIVQNLKVKQTEISNVLKPLRKKLSEFEQARHTIIHRGTYQDDELYSLELFTELEDSYRKSGDDLPVDIAFIPEARVEMTRELINKRKAQYTRFNSRVLQLVSDVFTVLHERFREEERRFRILTERGAQPGAAKKQRASPPISLFLPREMRLPSWVVPENVPANGGKILLQRPGMFSGRGMPRRAWEVASDATGVAF
jgi:hypothetical protein